MAFDGVFMSAIRREIEERAALCRVDKVYQPVRDELLILLRGPGKNLKLCLCAAADSPRIHFTREKRENPAAPPMFCMLLRKHLTGARLVRVEQQDLERVLRLDFECASELGDLAKKSLVMEIMGKHSNIVLVGHDGRVIDSVRHVDASVSSRRQVLAGLVYEPPPSQEKLSLIDTPESDIVDAALKSGIQRLDKALMSVIRGVSPVLARELCHRSCGCTEPFLSELDGSQRQALLDAVAELKRRVATGDFQPLLYREVKSGEPAEFSCVPILQYGSFVAAERYESFSALVDTYYSKKAKRDMLRQLASDTRKLVANAIERLSRKLDAQRAELKECAGRKALRLYGDLITANIHRIKKGDAYLIAENYGDPELPEVKIPLDVTLSPPANAQHYYRRYAKQKNAESVLQEQLLKGSEELMYLESVLDSIEKAQSPAELSEIREELAEAGYIKRRGQHKKQKAAPSAPRSFVSSDGFTIYVGRNNLQNDRLTLKTARKHDIWLHVKSAAGSHVIIETKGRPVPERTLLEAAELAAFYSKSAMSDNVPVDYTQVKNVKKSAGAKPGMVIYESHKTLYVTPRQIAENRRGHI